MPPETGRQTLWPLGSGNQTCVAFLAVPRETNRSRHAGADRYRQRRTRASVGDVSSGARLVVEGVWMTALVEEITGNQPIDAPMGQSRKKKVPAEPLFRDQEK